MTQEQNQNKGRVSALGQPLVQGDEEATFPEPFQFEGNGPFSALGQPLHGVDKRKSDDLEVKKDTE